MNFKYSSTKLLAASLCGVALAGCNAIETVDESPVIPTPAQTYVINGDVTGLSATRPVELKVVLTNNGLNNGTKIVSVRGTNALRFGAVNSGAGYAITINKSPAGRTCTIANGTGVATADIDNVTVTCVRDTTPLYTLTAAIASGVATAPPAGFKLTLTTEEGTETITPTAGQTSVTFALPVFYPGGTNPPSFNYTVTATNTVGGTTNSCAVTNGTGSLTIAPASPNITNVTVSACAFTISAAATYSAPPGGAASAMGANGLQLGLRNQRTGVIVAQAPLISAFSSTAVAIPAPASVGSIWTSNSSALYEVVVQSNPTNQTCIVENGGMAQLVTAQANVTVQVRCRDNPVLANQLKGVYQLDPRTVDDAGAAIPAPRAPTRNFLTFFPNGTFLYGTHHATATAGVEYGFYNYNPGAATLGFTQWIDTNGNGLGFSGGSPPAGTTFSGDFLTAFLPINWTAGLSGRSGYSEALSFTTFLYGPPGNVTATNVVKTTGSANVPGTLSLQFGTASTTNRNPVLTFTEPVNTAGQIQGTWTTADGKRVFVYNKTTFYGFHAGVNGAPNLQDACFTILDADLAESYYTRRGGDTGCMAATADTVDDARDGRVATGTVDVPNATTTNTTAPLIPGFEGRLPGAVSNTILSPSPVHYKVTPGTSGNPDTLVIQNTLNDVSIGDPITFKRTTTY